MCVCHWALGFVALEEIVDDRAPRAISSFHQLKKQKMTYQVAPRARRTHTTRRPRLTPPPPTCPPPAAGTSAVRHPDLTCRPRLRGAVSRPLRNWPSQVPLGEAREARPRPLENAFPAPVSDMPHAPPARAPTPSPRPSLLPAHARTPAHACSSPTPSVGRDESRELAPPPA